MVSTTAKGVDDFLLAGSRGGVVVEVGLGLGRRLPCWRRAGEVNVAICARRSTVSRGKRTARSRHDAKKVKMLHDEGLRTGSRER